MFSNLLCAAVVIASGISGQGVSAAAQGPSNTPPKIEPFTIGATFLLYVERSAPELDGVTGGGAVVFTARLNPRISVYAEGGRARFYADDQSGHRDFFLSGLLGFRPRADAELVILAGPTLLHSERHKFFGDLATNQAALTLGAEYVWSVGERLSLGVDWRTDLAAGMTVHRPGVSVRFGF